MKQELQDWIALSSGNKIMYLPTMLNRISHSHRGFTLIELMIAMTIFAVMSTMVMSVYLNTMTTSRKLDLTRYMNETAREITEKLSEDVREKWIDMKTEFDQSPSGYLFWTDQSDYTHSGTEFLQIGNSWITYVYGSKTETGIRPCIGDIKINPNIHCGLYRITGGNYDNLVDSFIPDDSKKRVKIDSLRFYISGWDFTTKKVTLVMTLWLMPRSWVPASMLANTKLHIQTTISERGWQKK